MTMEPSSKVEITILSQLPAASPESYFERLRAKLDLWPQEAEYGGPSAVRSNLIGGLARIGQPFRLNPPQSEMNTEVGILGGISALRRGISAKEAGRAKWLVAGPNLVVLPDEYNGLLMDPAIDLIVTPCKWVSNAYERVQPELSGRLAEWAVGVDEEYWKPSSVGRRSNFDFIIFAKIREKANRGIVNYVEKELDGRGLSYRRMKYGSFRKSTYLQSLRECRAMIYLTESESQGIALFEAWACDVQTLVWDRKYWEWHGRRFEASSAPYLSTQCGLTFNDLSAFPEKLESFVAMLPTFRPRDYICSSFTQAQAAHSYSQLLMLGEKTSQK